MRNQRMYRSKAVYELCFRAREGLPLPARPLINLILQSALARTQKDNKVNLCTLVWMSNHPHIIIESLDTDNLAKFYAELKKKITEYLKRLLGDSHKVVWRGRTMVAEILDLETAIDRQVYIFLNPAKANLVDSIDDYPGVTTWKAFLNAKPNTNSYHEVEVPWIRLPSVPTLSSPCPSKNEEKKVIKQLLAKNKHNQKLRVYPFAWLKAFGITEPEEIESIRKRIIERVKKAQKELKENRAKNKTTIIGSERLTTESLEVAHTPQKNARRIYFLSSVAELRVQFIKTFKAFRDECRECLGLFLKGFRDVVWPPGAYIPPLRTLVNPILA